MKTKTLFIATIVAAGCLQFAQTSFANGDQTKPSDEQNIPGVAAQPDSYFFTGRPYDAELGGYVFAARVLNPETGRWNTPDPSGFPDGPNNRIYAPVPTSQLDFGGLLTITGTPPTTEKITTIYDGHTFQLDTWAAIGINSTSFSTYNGWTFSDGGPLSGKLSIDVYQAQLKGSGTLGTHIEISTSHISGDNYNWIQRVNTNSVAPGESNPTFDNYPPGSRTPNSDPFYAGTKATGADPTFYDFSSRPGPYFAPLISGSESSITWAGTLYIVNENTTTQHINVFDGIQWGWTIKMLE